MKQKDIAIIIAVAGVSLILAVIVAGFIFIGPSKLGTKVVVLDSVSSTFPVADKAFFNDQSIDSTQTVTIGTNSNAQPFNK